MYFNFISFLLVLTMFSASRVFYSDRRLFTNAFASFRQRRRRSRTCFSDACKFLTLVNTFALLLNSAFLSGVCSSVVSSSSSGKMAKRVTVYDICKYVHCNNGKLTGHRLFRFPEAEERQMMWIENTGKYICFQIRKLHKMYIYSRVFYSFFSFF